MYFFNQFFVIAILILFGGLIWAALDFWRLGKAITRPISQQSAITYTGIPTIFIHGYRGNRYSFGRMLHRFYKLGAAQKTLVIKIAADGTWKTNGNWVFEQNNPCIQVLFCKNTADVSQQVQWLTPLMAALKAKGVTTVNLVGHSMGAVTAVAYCAQALTASQPKIAKVVTIAGPFNDLELGKDTAEILSYPLTKDGPQRTTPIYEYLQQHMAQVPYPIKFLNLVGNILPNSRVQHDGSVATSSGLSLKYILMQTPHIYHQAVLRGANAAHSLLHENSLVDWNIIEFLWRPSK
ncbi:alpha/beta fold hydrolase [Agrilactobacillus yilanensis]|uniref:Alpha/beta fold hydrolase n=1 Tax=Agrilactobacillus yilanensis TaxID=2485997 RepID=A0ABW4J7E3_9LACO|nr:alpha/beta fold hydrolase [Agrilactobacillus yilanensis]